MVPPFEKGGVGGFIFGKEEKGCAYLYADRFTHANSGRTFISSNGILAMVVEK